MTLPVAELMFSIWISRLIELMVNINDDDDDISNPKLQFINLC